MTSCIKRYKDSFVDDYFKDVYKIIKQMGQHGVLPQAKTIKSIKPVDKQPVDKQPVEDKPVEAQPVEAQPVEAQPVEDKPIKPVEDEPDEPQPKLTVEPSNPTQPTIILVNPFDMGVHTGGVQLINNHRHRINNPKH